MTELKFKIGDHAKVIKHEAQELIGLTGKVFNMTYSNGGRNVKYHVNLGSAIPGGETVEAILDGDQLTNV